MWLRNTYFDKIDILPEDEQEWHIPEPRCECRPELSRDEHNRLVIVHRSRRRARAI